MRKTIFVVLLVALGGITFAQWGQYEGMGRPMGRQRNSFQDRPPMRPFGRSGNFHQSFGQQGRFQIPQDMSRCPNEYQEQRQRGRGMRHGVRGPVQTPRRRSMARGGRAPMQMQRGRFNGRGAQRPMQMQRDRAMGRGAKRPMQMQRNRGLSRDSRTPMRMQRDRVMGRAARRPMQMQRNRDPRRDSRKPVRIQREPHQEPGGRGIGPRGKFPSPERELE